VDSSKFVEKLQRRVVQNFMDIIILTEMKKGSLSGYDVISLVQKRFGLLMSSGTVYSLMYSLERDGLIKGVWNSRKRVYVLTEKGERDIKSHREGKRGNSKFSKENYDAQCNW